MLSSRRFLPPLAVMLLSAVGEGAISCSTLGWINALQSSYGAHDGPAIRQRLLSPVAVAAVRADLAASVAPGTSTLVSRMIDTAATGPGAAQRAEDLITLRMTIDNLSCERRTIDALYMPLGAASYAPATRMAGGNPMDEPDIRAYGAFVVLLLTAIAISAAISKLHARQARRSRRHVCVAPVTVRMSGAVRAATLRNISQTGCLISCDIAPGAATTLSLTLGQRQIPARVIWCGADMVGLRFDRRLRRAELQDLLQSVRLGRRKAPMAPAAAS